MHDPVDSILGEEGRQVMGKLNVDGTEIQVLQIEEDDYISLTDMY